MAKEHDFKKEIREDYRKILEFIKRAEKNQPIDLKEMLKTNLHLFLSMKDTFEKGSEEEKKEALYILSEVFTLFMNESKKMKEKNGASDADIMAVGENPNFFTPEQWKIIQEAKEDMNKMGMTLTDLLYKKTILSE
jgi:hypothetical protein